MALLYARSNLTTMTDPAGWSYTSGGAPAGVDPGGYDLIFDSNSGNARLIVGNLTTQSIKMVGSAPMTFSGYIVVKGSSVLKGSFASFEARNETTVWIELDVEEASFIDFKVVYSYCRIIKGALLVSTQLSASANNGKSAQLVMATADKRIVAGVVYITQDPDTGAYGSIRADGGSVELTGVTGNFQYVAYLSGQLILGVNGTLKLSNKSDAVKTINSPNQSSAAIWGNFVNDTGTGNPNTGGVLWSTPNASFTSYNAGRGCRNFFSANMTYTANNWIIEGAGPALETYMASNTNTTVILSMPNSGQIIATNARFRYISLSNGRVLNGSDGGSNSGITFLKIFSRFFPFF